MESRSFAEELNRPSKKRNFASDVMKIMSGTAFGQVLAVLALPVLTRLYAPEAFGILGIFMAITGIVGVVVCMRYELTIILPESDKEAKKLLLLSLFFTAAWTLASILAILLLKGRIVTLAGNSGLANYLWLIPAGIAVHGLHLAISHWNTRKAQFGQLAGSYVVQSLLTTGTKLGAGIAGLATGGALIMATIMGRLLASVQLIIASIRHERKQRLITSSSHYGKHRDSLANPEEVGSHAGTMTRQETEVHPDRPNGLTVGEFKRLSMRYSNISIFNSISSLFNIAAQYAPLLVLSFLFTPAAAGHYVLSYKILKAPSGLLGKSAKKVFFQRAAESYRQQGEMIDVVRNVGTHLTIIGLFFMTLMITGLSPFVTTIFGESWAVAGTYIPWIAIWVVFAFIANPLGSVATILSREHVVLSFHVGFSITQITALAAGGFIFHSALAAIALYSLMGILYHGSMLLWLFRISRVSISRYLSDSAPFIGVSSLFIGAYILLSADHISGAGLLILNLLYVAVYSYLSRHVWTGLTTRLFISP